MHKTAPIFMTIFLLLSLTTMAASAKKKNKKRNKARVTKEYKVKKRSHKKSTVI